MDELQSYWIKKWVNISYTRIVCQVCSGCVLANCVCVLRMCCMYYTSVKKLTSQHRASCSTLCSCAPRLAGEGAKTGRRMQWLAKLADVCVCVRVCLCFCKPHRCICMPYQIWLLREICASALVNRLYKLNIMRCATFTYHLFSGLGLGRDPGPGMNSAVWMHHTSTVLEGTYMAIIHFVLLIASFCEVTKEEHMVTLLNAPLCFLRPPFFKERV